MLTTSVVLIILAAVFGSAAMTAVLGWLLYRQHTLSAGAGSSETLVRLGEEVDSLRAELMSTHSDISDLSERLDFTERMLSAPDESSES